VKEYLVGGAVRDALLGIPVKDRDWVVVGATPQEMLDAGFKQVGADFPVFLHPETHGNMRSPVPSASKDTATMVLRCMPPRM